MTVEELVRELQYYIADGKGKLPVVAKTFYAGVSASRSIEEVAQELGSNDKTLSIVLLDEKLTLVK